MFSRHFSKFSRLSVTIFLIFFNGFVNSAGYSTIGEGRHTIENGTVTLANGSRIATKVDVDEYQNQPRACNVEIDAEGNIILNFDWFTNTAYEGCTVDLVTEIGGDKETNVVEFTVSFDHYGESELNTCMSCGGMSGNMLILSNYVQNKIFLFRIPFVFNIDSNEFDELVQMPPNEWPCQRPWNKLWSSSEIRICYSGDEIQIGSFIDTPGPLNFWFWCHRDANRTFQNLKQLDFNVEINGETFVVNHTDYNFSRCKSENFAKPLCSPVKPKVWPIVGNAKLEGKGLLAFSLLPRYQIIFRRGCHFVSLKFSGKKYSLLTTLPPLPPKPLTTMNGTTIDEIITLFKNNGDFEYESSTSDSSKNLTNQLNSSSTQTNKTSIIAKINGTTMFSTLTNEISTGGNLTNEQTTPTEETTINEIYSGTPQIIPAIIVTTTEATTIEETTLLVETTTEDFFTTTEEATTDEDTTEATTYEDTTEDTTDEETTEYPTEETSIPTTSTTTTIVTSSEMTTTFIDPTATSASPTEEETTSTSQMVLPPLKTSENLPEITTPTTTEAIKTTQQEALTATKSPSKIWIFIVVVVLLICLSVGGVFYYLNYMKKEEHSVEEGVKREDRSNEEVDKTERETEEDSMKILKDKKKHPRFDETQRETKRETTIKQLFDKTQRSESEEKSLKEEEKLDATSKTVSEEEVTIENKTLLSVYASQTGNGSKLKEAKVEGEKSKKEEEKKVEDKNNNKNSSVAL
ncbi:unnamed protein product [Meloidogyne enterolobii]|uniref:Uncharacterized protein n=2 Tax=Meloidogyne enterolobii TaxID=390850 RepID=A0ACB1A128_MELEN